jgi:hypothetical protein
MFNIIKKDLRLKNQLIPINKNKNKTIAKNDSIRCISDPKKKNNNQEMAR